MERILSLQNEIEELRKTLNEKEIELHALKKSWNTSAAVPADHQYYKTPEHVYEVPVDSSKLPRWAVERYCRQILIPEIGTEGQKKICKARVLIIGAGGLGYPAGSYLAGAGVGEIGIVDYDTVDVSNLHRQLWHSEQEQCMNKVDSAADFLRRINSNIKISTYHLQINTDNALDLVSKYDVVLDCSDNVPTRYLINDACIFAGVPLISGSALKMEGQLTIYGYKAAKNPLEKDSTYQGPCYRCLFPSPPPPEVVGSCSASGIVGPVTGVIGALQALEAIKLVSGQLSGNMLVGRLLLFDGADCVFRVVKLRNRNPECESCSEEPTITELLDYEGFCNMRAKEGKSKKSRKDFTIQKRKLEKEKRMSGQSYFGFRKTLSSDHSKWVQDVPKSERKLGPVCKSEFCSKNIGRTCTKFDENTRKDIFNNFWYNMNWIDKKKYVKSLIDTIPPKRRRLKIKGDISRKGDSKLYHLINGNDRLPVCRNMFLNTLGIKEAMVRSWLNASDVPKTKTKKIPVTSISVNAYLDELTKIPPKCQICKDTTAKMYLDYNIKNCFQLYNKYCNDMQKRGVKPASRKTFTKTFNSKNISIFKPKNDNDICDLVESHNQIKNVNNFILLDNNIIMDQHEPLMSFC